MKHCPKCDRKYYGREIYCSRCGVLLEREREPNRCSANKTELCGTARLDDEDRFCPYCGASATYLLIEDDEFQEWPPPE